MSTLKVPGATLYYETEGSGQPLILIPGANGDGFIFMPISQFLKDKFTVVRYDRRGYSRSELDAPLGPEYHDQDCLLRLKEDAADVAALIRKLDAGPAVVFGSSSGAQVALQVLIDYPELVDTLFCHEVPLANTRTSCSSTAIPAGTFVTCPGSKQFISAAKPSIQNNTLKGEFNYGTGNERDG